MQLKDMFVYQAGNLDTLGGLSPQAPTLGQEGILERNASKLVEDMQNLTVSFIRNVVRDIAWYQWTDPLLGQKLVMNTPGGVDVPVEFHPEDRSGDFLDYNIDINPYSMAEKSPASQLNAIQQVVTNFIVPFMPLLQQQGLTVNVEGMLRSIARLSDMDDLDDILMFQRQPMQQAPGPLNSPTAQPGAAALPATTTRRYIREGRPTATRQGRDGVLTAALMGANPQQKEVASLGA